MMINNCSASTSNPLPENEGSISPPLVDHPMDPILFKAAMEGNTNCLQALQDLSNLRLKRTICKETVLHIATQFNRMDFARLSIQICPRLLSLGNSSGDTALHVAAREGHTEIVKLFLSCNYPAPTRIGNLENDTALHCCARSGKTECVKLLVQADPEVCAFLNKADESPLYLLITSRFADYVTTTTECIINYARSSASHKGPNGLTALHGAVLCGETVFELPMGIERITETERIIEPLMGRERITESLVLWRREMISEGDSFGMTPLHYAALYGKIETIQLFLQYDSHAIYCFNNDGQSALHIAAFFGKAKILEELVKCRPDCYNMVDNKGRTALHAAVLGDQHGVVEFIIKTPSLAMLTNKVDKDGNSPMHLAAYFRSYKIIKSLRCKEEKFFLNHNSYTPFDLYEKQFNKLCDLQQLEDIDFAKAIEARNHLKNNKGAVAKHESAKEELKRMNIEVVTNSTEEISLRNNQLNKSAEGKKADYGEVNLLVAMLVATVTFAAGFTVPGGLINNGVDEGLATFTNKPIFKAFVFCNTCAFCCSVHGVLVHFMISFTRPTARVYYEGIAASTTPMAIIAMVLAFFFGTSVVLTKSTALSLVPCYILAYFLLIYGIAFLLMWFSALGGDADTSCLPEQNGLWTPM